MRACLLLAILSITSVTAHAYEPIHVGFLWHMHQPIYYPYESPIVTDANERFSFSVIDVHNQRFGPYTTWPRDALQAGLGEPHLGAQVSFTGSLIENLNHLEAAGINGGLWTNWDTGYDQAVSWTTTLGNPRLDLVAFGYHHPLMPLLDVQDIRMQIRLHRHLYEQTWPGDYSRGMFPAETAFSTRMIPALVAEGLDWVLVDNMHFDRACLGYPHTNQSGLFTPNPADQLNPDPAASGGAWVQLNNLWAPSRVSVPFGYQPHYVQHVDPATGAITRMIAVPAARYEGNEDGRGGYGAFLYDQVMDQYIQYNTDPAHPMFVVLHHDGDNYGGGSEAYYHHNFQNMVDWVSTDPDYDVTTVADYLERFPPDLADVIHVEDGAWAGADNGDPEFKKWLGDPNANGWSPDRNSWAVLTAAKHRVFHAEALAPAVDLQNVLLGAGTQTEQAWHWLLCGQASDYWYWDGTEIWDSNVTRACNQAVVHADAVLAGQPDALPPTIFLPQREPYNPGGYEWGTAPESSDFEVWTFVYDTSGLASVTLYWRADLDGANPLTSSQNETYAGGPEVGSWQGGAMSATDVPPPPGVLVPTYRALRYGGMVAGQLNVLLDYYIEAVDTLGNVQRSPIVHVWVGEVVVIAPDPPQAGDPALIRYNPAGRPLGTAPQVYLHYGFNDWNPIIVPDPALTWDVATQTWQITIPIQATAWQLDFVFHDGAGTWDNNGGADWHYAVEGGIPPQEEWVMDGQRDAGAILIGANGGLQLYAGLRDTELYVAAPDAGEGNDHFILLAASPGAMQAAPWAKAGQVARWAAYLGNENNNGWAGWFDTTATARTATGGGSGWLEGTIDLAGEFGTMPAVVYVAFAPYGTNNGDELVTSAQIPASIDGDGDVAAAEYVAFPLVRPGDLNCDGQVGFADINPFVLALSNPSAWQTAYPDCPLLNGDVNADGTFDFGDINPFVALLAGVGS